MNRLREVEASPTDGAAPQPQTVPEEDREPPDALVMVPPRVTPGASAWKQSLTQAASLQQQGRADEAATLLSRVLRDPSCPGPAAQEVLTRLGDLCLNTFGDASAARTVLRRLPVMGGSALQADLATIVADQYMGPPDAEGLSRQMKALAAKYLTPDRSSQAHQPRGGRSRRRPARSRLRIALISNQWCASPVAFLSLGVLQSMATQAELVILDRGGKLDWARSAVESLASDWHDLRGRSADGVFESLSAVDADALIDMAGWTDPTTMQALARRPVRRQLKWVGGQSATTGAHCFDGFVADERQVPVGCETLYSEPVLRAATGYVTYTPPPYWKPGSVIDTPPARATREVVAGTYAIAANPVKISPFTVAFVRTLKPRRLVLIDARWRHAQTRRSAAEKLGDLMEVTEFRAPSTHPEYLETLAATPAFFVDTTPYSMGLAAIELRLLGKPVVQPPRPALRSISECHCAGHLGATSFGHHRALADTLLGWCRG